MKNKVSTFERQRRNEQSIKANPLKYQKSRLKRGCCKNCSKNIEAEQRVSAQTISGVPITQKIRKCGALNHQIINEFDRCEYFERINNTNKIQNKVINAIIGIK